MSDQARNMLVPKRLVLHNLGPFRDFELRFEPGTDPTRADIHLLVGINGTGKTTLLHAIAVALSLVPPILLQPWATAPDAYVLLETADATVVARADGNDEQASAILRNAMPDAQSQAFSVIGVLAVCRHHHEGKPTAIERMAWGLHSPQNQPPLESAAFLYRTARKIAEPAGFSSRELKQQTAIGHWVLNQHLKAVLARSEGAEEEARAHERSKDLIVDAFGRLFDQKLGFEIDRQRLEAHFTVDGVRVPAQVLAQGMQSLLAWLADLITTLDRLEWATYAPVTERPFVVLVDELEVHLHPALQRKVLDVFQTLFPNATLFGSTHSPHVVISPSDARIYPLRLGPNGPTCEPLKAQDGLSASAALQDIFSVDEFNPEVQRWLQELMALGDDQLRGDDSQLARFEELATKLSQLGTETANLVGLQRRQLARRRP